MEHAGILEEGENLVRIGHYEEAFERFMSLERGVYEASYLRPCQMAMADQLAQPQLEELFFELQKEVGRDNAHAIFNYGCVKAHLKDIKAAKALLRRASDMGITSAAGVLSSI